jgi:hypothetical protein
MRLARWYFFLTALLAALSLALYLAQVLIFQQPRDTLFYLFQDLAFVPLQVLLVTLILNDLMARREKRALMNKMNMVIGAFFAELGNQLTARLVQFDPRAGELNEILRIGPDWDRESFRRAAASLAARSPRLDARSGDLAPLREFLSGKRSFVLSLLENQNLLEHQRFTDLLWAVTHLAEELQLRDNLHSLPDSDLEHLSGDLRRIYALLLEEWLAYAQHLQRAYPYMYSLMVRNNPFDPAASVTIGDDPGRR